MIAFADARGHTVAGIVAALALLLLLGAVAAAGLGPAARSRSVEAAAQAMVTRLRLLSLAARQDGRSRAMVFSAVGNGEPLVEAVDRDGDGLARRGIEDGRDACGTPYRIGRDYPGVSLGRPAWPSIRELPPAGGTIDPRTPPVRFGRSRMVVLDPEGHATPGSVFLTDGRDGLCAVVVHGATARVQAWCYRRQERTWSRR